MAKIKKVLILSVGEDMNQPKLYSMVQEYKLIQPSGKLIQPFGKLFDSIYSSTVIALWNIYPTEMHVWSEGIS